MLQCADPPAHTPPSPSVRTPQKPDRIIPVFASIGTSGMTGTEKDPGRSVRAGSAKNRSRFRPGDAGPQRLLQPESIGTPGPVRATAKRASYNLHIKCSYRLFLNLFAHIANTNQTNMDQKRNHPIPNSVPDPAPNGTLQSVKPRRLFRLNSARRDRSFRRGFLFGPVTWRGRSSYGS
jgi:hypothetical protein